MDKIKSRILNKTTSHFIWQGAEVYVKEAFKNEDISIKRVLQKVNNNIPAHLLRGLDAIYVGQFDFLKSKSLEAAFQDGIIFLDNNKPSEEECADDIIHELAHLVEQEYGFLIYSDKQIEQEFLSKRKQLWRNLVSENFDVNLSDMLQTSYNKNLDMFLYQVVGYSTLSLYTMDLFYSPYGATSLREYFANCFEGFFWDKQTDRIKKTSPKVFDKLVELLYYKENEE